MSQNKSTVSMTKDRLTGDISINVCIKQDDLIDYSMSSDYANQVIQHHGKSDQPSDWLFVASEIFKLSEDMAKRIAAQTAPV